MLSKFTVRRMLPGEEAVCEPMWQKGFHEMWPSSYRKMLQSPGFKLFVLLNIGVGGFLCAQGTPALLAVGACLLAFSLSLPIPPLGGAIFSFLMWRAVLNQRFLFKPSPRDVAYWVAEAAEGGAIVGCVCVKEGHTLAREAERGAPEVAGEASVWRLSVDPAARKLGVGRALMLEAEAYARARGCSAMSLITGNDASRAFYVAIGYGEEQAQRAQRVLFGKEGRPSTILGRLRASFLPSRLRSTILFKELR